MRCIPIIVGLVLEQIDDLLNADAPALDTLEETLTDGYAQALALEAERGRLERRLGEVDEELSRLRGRLATLHARLRHLRRS